MIFGCYDKEQRAKKLDTRAKNLIMDSITSDCLIPMPYKLANKYLCNYIK